MMALKDYDGTRTGIHGYRRGERKGKLPGQ
jgi:hypothetical protein